MDIVCRKIGVKCVNLRFMMYFLFSIYLFKMNFALVIVLSNDKTLRKMTLVLFINR